MKTRQRLFSLALSAGLLAGSLPASWAAWFADTQGNWAQQAIQSLSDQNIIGGYPDGTFRPQGMINRAEFSAILVKALGIQPGAYGYSSFRDVPSGYWAIPAIETVRDQGIVTGYPDGTFGPTRSISRAETLAIIANAAKLSLPDTATTENILSSYYDAGSIPQWARRGVAATLQSGLFVNEPTRANRIDAQLPATRAEVAALVNNLKQAQAGQSTIANNNNTTQNNYNNNTGNYNNAYVAANPGALQAHIATVPAYTKFTGTLQQQISSELNRPGDLVTVTLDTPLADLNGLAVIPAGSQLKGQVAQVEPAGRAGKHGSVDIRFNEVVLPSGFRQPIVAQIATEKGLLEGGTTKGRVLKSLGATAVGAGLGAALGTAMGPLSGGKAGRGAVYGTAIGAGAGALTAAAMKGNPVEVNPGDRLEIQLQQALTIPVQ